MQVGILGLQTPAVVVHWERPENIVGCVFGDAMVAANKYVPIMRDAGADVIVVAAHRAATRPMATAVPRTSSSSWNEVPGIDVILAGHAHTTIPTASQFINGVLVTEPNYHTRNISDIRITGQRLRLRLDRNHQVGYDFL